MNDTGTVVSGPNIILICNDDYAQWALSCYGDPCSRTPSLDYLARTGVVMENAFTPIPVCSPARASLLTGLLPSQHGIHDYLATGPDLPPQKWLTVEASLPRLLQKAGYRTGMCGKWHLGDDDIPQPGFDHWFSISGDYPIPHSGRYRYSRNGVMEHHDGYKTQVLTDDAIGFIRARDDARPFFLQLGYVATHHPWSGHPERLVEPFRPGARARVSHDACYPFGVQNLESTFDTRHDPAEALAQYYAGVAGIDEGVGRILDEITSNGVAGDTLIVFTSDHGLCCGHHGIWGKGNGTLPLNMVEEAIRVPLVIWRPDHLLPGVRRREFVDHLDLFLTILDCAGINPGTADDSGFGMYPGRSFLPLLENRAAGATWRTAQFGEYGPVRMVRTERYKLVQRYPEEIGELFDLQEDPREERSLYADPAYAAVLNQLRDQLEAHFAAFAESPVNGLLVRDLPRHNATEAWRDERCW